MRVFGICCTERWKHCSQLCFPYAAAHTQISRRILIMRQCAEEPCEREGGGGAFSAAWEACDIFSPVFVSSIRAHAAYQHAGAYNKLHVVLYRRFDWCRVYELCVCGAHSGQRDRASERERVCVCVQNGCHTHTVAESTAREGIWSSPWQACRAASTCLIKGTQPLYVWMFFKGSERQFSGGFLAEAVFSALQHCGWGERGEESLCGTPSWAPNQAPPCGAQANRQPAAEVKDWQLQERAAGREGLLGNLDPSFSLIPQRPQLLKKI